MRLPSSIGPLLILMLLALVPAATADSWAPPSVATYESPDGRFRFTTTPRTISSAAAFFEDKADGRPLAGSSPNSKATAPRGRLEHREDNGRWKTLWERSLLNDVSPVSAIISAKGVVATFDDWHMVGTGDHTVVIYGKDDGAIVGSFTLSDLLPGTYISALPHSVSSLSWKRTQAFSADERTLVLGILIPSESDDRDGPTVDLYIDLETRRIMMPTDGSWERALAEAERIAAMKETAEAARIVYFKNPLLGPLSMSEPAWHQYLWEAFYRLDADWKNGSCRTKVLRAPDAPDYEPTVGWLREALIEHDSYSECLAMVASPASPDNLLAVLSRIIPNVPAGSLSGHRVYIAAPLAYREPLAAILKPTGVAFVHIDPAAPMPQRPERLER